MQNGQAIKIMSVTHHIKIQGRNGKYRRCEVNKREFKFNGNGVYCRNNGNSYCG